jgi:hypothetical protein
MTTQEKIIRTSEQRLTDADGRSWRRRQEPFGESYRWLEPNR